MLILHIATRAQWEAAQQTGLYDGNTLRTEGFIHCCTPDQLMHVLIKHYPSAVGHVIVEIETEDVEPEIRWEGDPEQFPHIYGPLNLSAVTRTKQLW
jgi:uncharacterized protein (DUF952 family)